jgi:DNA-binding response OmpR family regulator
MASVLIIEPDRLLGQTYREYLAHNGHKPRVCTGAQQAVEIIDEKVPDIIVLELQLSDHGGIEFLYELRSYTEWQHIPIIVHSLVPHNLFSDNTLQMKNMGVTHFLYKPSTNLMVLNRAINEALELVKK